LVKGKKNKDSDQRGEELNLRRPSERERLKGGLEKRGEQTVKRKLNRTISASKRNLKTTERRRETQGKF